MGAVFGLRKCLLPEVRRDTQGDGLLCIGNRDKADQDTSPAHRPQEAYVMAHRVQSVGRPFSKLSKAAKERALEWGRDRVNQSFDSDLMTDDLQNYAAEKHGVKAGKCYWSLGHCQGDGVAFYGCLDLDALREKSPETLAIFAGLRLLGVNCSLHVNIEGGNGHYHHHNSMDPTVEVYDCEDKDQERADEAAEALQSFLEGFLKEVSRDVEEYGYEVIDGQLSDESVQDFIQSNGYCFTKAGEFAG